MLALYNMLSLVAGVGIGWFAHLGGLAFGWIYLRVSAFGGLDNFRRWVSPVPDEPEDYRAVPRRVPRNRDRTDGADGIDEVVAKNGLEKGQIDWLIPHQANIRIISATARRLALPMERVVLTVREHGNTSAASVPMALDTAIRDGRVKRGDLLLLEAFGGGFTWGASLVRY